MIINVAWKHHRLVALLRQVLQIQIYFSKILFLLLNAKLRTNQSFLNQLIKFLKILILAIDTMFLVQISLETNAGALPPEKQKSLKVMLLQYFCNCHL